MSAPGPATTGDDGDCPAGVCALPNAGGPPFGIGIGGVKSGPADSAGAADGAPWIDTTHVHADDPEYQKLLKQVSNADGTLDNIMAIHARQPSTLRTHFEMYADAMGHGKPSDPEGRLSRAEKELAGVVTSQANRCVYCTTHHSNGLARRWPDDRAAAVEKIKAGLFKDADLSAREAAIAAYAFKLTTEPGAMVKADVEQLRQNGLSDDDVLELAHVVAYFNYANRVANGLGVPLGGAEGDPGKWPV